MQKTSEITHAPARQILPQPAAQTVYMMPTEWRWVITVSSALILLAFIPMLWLALRGTAEWQFMGALHNYLDGATYLSKMVLGQNGDWLVHFQHTPEAHSGGFIQVLYLALGHLARLTGIPAFVIYHVGRVGASLAMYAAIYQFGAVIWTRVRTRRLFFGIAAVGSGLGWLFAPLTGSGMFPDFPLLPEAYPFYSTLMNVHFPLTLAALIMLAHYFIIVFRPGAEHDSLVERGWVTAGLLSVAVALLYPQALVPFIGAILLAFGQLYLRERRLSPNVLRWVLATLLPAIPLAAYYVLLITNNPAFATWSRQNVTLAPDLLTFLIGFGIPLLIALPSLFRAVRRSERDGDSLMLFWLVAMLIAVYLPTAIQRRFAVGLMIPIAYFATRAIEDVWLPYIRRPLRAPLIAVFFPLIAISPLLILFLPALPAIAGSPRTAVGVFLERDYVAAFDWINTRASTSDVILASPVVSAWVPGWAGTRVVYGHPYETLEADVKRAAVEAWYAGTADCRALLEQYNVRFILIGPEERAMGVGGCEAGLQVQVQSGDVIVYSR